MFTRWDGRPPERHRSFRTMEQLHQRIVTDPPHSCFHSTAYYTDAGAYKMDEKGWQGADLIFDLDGDHLPGVTDLDFPSMLEQIQEEAWKLWNDFLEPDLGFREENLQLTFSGHRGFHLHYRDPHLLSLDRDARREIVSHIRGEGVSIDAVMRGGLHGWRRRIESGIENVIERLEALAGGDEDQRKHLRSFISKRAAARDAEVKRMSNAELDELARLSTNSDSRRRLLDSKYRRNVFGRRLNDVFWELVRGDASVILGGAGETDEGVTVDVKRVIRWLSSLHGKSGLEVTEFPLNRLDPDGTNPFDALTEAVPFQGAANERVRLLHDDIRARISDETVEGFEGDELETTESMAMFLTLKGWAEPL